MQIIPMKDMLFKPSEVILHYGSVIVAQDVNDKDFIDKAHSVMSGILVAKSLPKNIKPFNGSLS